LRDTWVAGNASALTHTNATVAIALDVTPTATPTAINALQNYMSALIAYTNHVTKTGPGTYVQTPWNTASGYGYQYERVSSRKVGTFNPVKARRKAVIQF
jgi:hypothetical protein